MPNLKILHVSDVHFGATRHSRINPTTGEDAAAESIRRCFDATITAALENDVDAYLLTGDMFDSGRPSTENIARLMDGVKTLTNAGIAVIAEDGNHGRHYVKPGHRGAAHLLKAAGATVYDTVGVHHIDTKNGPLHFLGIPWPERATLLKEAGAENADLENRDDIIASYLRDCIEDAVDDANLPSGEPFIIGSHSTLSGVPLARGSETIINTRGLFEEVLLPLDDVEALGSWYNAFGHIHHHQHLSEYTSYAGSLDALTFGEAGEEKGSLLVTLNPDAAPTRTLLPTPYRHLLNLHMGADVDEQIAQVREGTLVKVHLDEGETELDTAVKKSVAEAGGSIVRIKPAPRKAQGNALVIKEGVSVAEAAQQWAAAQKLSTSMTDKVLNRLNTYLGEV